MKRRKFLTFGEPFIGADEIREVVATLKSGWLSSGPRVEKFESQFRKYIGCKFAVALNSCTAGIHLSLLACGIKPKDEVITSPLTFAATANVILHAGAKPVFADVNRDSMNIDPREIKKRITPKTKAIIPVHFAGRPCDMDEITAISHKYGLFIIGDAAHAVGAAYKNRKIGQIGDFTCFSFYANKNITTGEGGMVTTNNPHWTKKIRILSMHGISQDAWKRYTQDDLRHYQVLCPGFKYNMTDIQAAIGIHQLSKINKWLKRRTQIWKRYDQALKGLPLKTPFKDEAHISHARHLYTILLDIDKLKCNRFEIKKRLRKENIGTGIHFISLHLSPYYKKAFGYTRGDFPNAEYISDRTLSLPLSAKLKDRDIEDVISAVRKVVKG
jgi:dTDP-4-amino-4,6-dideoxygalactose transaminase